MGGLVYGLGAVVSTLCAVLLLRGFLRMRTRLLLWSGICFIGLAASNCVLFVDVVLLPATVTLYTWRLGLTAAAMLVLVYGLIWESDR